MGEPGVQAKDGLGGQRQRALGTNDELGEVVARGGFDELAPGAHDLAGAEHGGQPEHLVAGHAVAHGPHAAGVGGHVAAEAGRTLPGEHRVDQPHGGRCLVELGEGDSRLDHGHVIVGVDF